MYYKLIKDGKVVDVINRLTTLKWQEKHNTMILCDPSVAQAVLGSDDNTIWCDSALCSEPINCYDIVDIVPIDKYEYDQLKIFSYRTLEEVLDEYTLRLINEGVI